MLTAKSPTPAYRSTTSWRSVRPATAPTTSGTRYRLDWKKEAACQRSEAVPAPADERVLEPMNAVSGSVTYGVPANTTRALGLVPETTVRPGHPVQQTQLAATRHPR